MNVIVQYFLAIGQTVPDIWQFFYSYFQNGDRPPAWFVISMFGQPTKSIWWNSHCTNFIVGIDAVVSIICKC